MTPQTLSLLEWDTDLFGYPVAQLNVRAMDEHSLQLLLDEARRRQIRLVYGRVEPDDGAAIKACCACGGRLVDVKTTYGRAILAEDPVEMPGEVRLYTEQRCTDGLLALALQSGLYSRFRVDPGFVKNEYEKLYRRWIELSVSGEIAREVLLIGDASNPTGLVTVGERHGNGAIGLAAVDESMRGRSLGTKLLRAALARFASWKVSGASVVTQQANHGAARLYQSGGFQLVSSEHIYHFWL